ncbi:MAG: hypothetical protein ACXWDI_13710 [Nocardioides sp.]
MSDDVSDAFPGSDDIDQSLGQDDGHDSQDGHDASGLDDAPDGPENGPDLSATAPAVPVERTGNPVVDSVLDSLRELEQMPVSEHVAVFEAAHDRLRGALADAGEPPADS